MSKEFSRKLRETRGFICDMDGVVYHGSRVLPAAQGFVAWLQRAEKRFLFLTNSSERSPEGLSDKLRGLGIDVAPEHFYTSALATAGFLAGQGRPGKVYVIGERGLHEALEQAGFTESERDVDYVVLGETDVSGTPGVYTYEKLDRAVNLVRAGARLIATNPDVSRPTEEGVAPGCAALVAPIEMTVGRRAYFVGKPNPLMMRQALHKLDCAPEESVIIGDRMDTDIVAGVESEIETILALTGVTRREQLADFAYQPDFVVESLGEIVAAAED